MVMIKSKWKPKVWNRYLAAADRLRYLEREIYNTSGKESKEETE